MAKSLLRLLGFSYAEDKLWPFQLLAEMLGVEFELPNAPEGQPWVRNKASRIKELVSILENAFQCKKFVPAELPSFIGKLQYAKGQIFGRAGRLALADLRSLGQLSRGPFALGGGHVETLRILQQRLSFGKLRPHDVMPLGPPILLFTDGILEYEPNGRARDHRRSPL